MTPFNRFHLSSYETDNPAREGELLNEAVKQTRFWLKELGFNLTQREQTKIFSGRTKSAEDGKVKFMVFALIPLDAGSDFNAVWDGFLSETLSEDITLELEKTGVR